MTKITNDSETLAENQQVITVAAFIAHQFNGVWKVFLPKRSSIKKFLPNVFELPGGHLDFGEDLISGLKREVQEEIHKTISVGDPFYAFTYLNQVKKSHSVEIVFFAKFVDTLKNIHLNPQDHSEFVWADEPEAIQLYLSKGENDLELPAIKRGFNLLHRANLNLG